MRTAFVAVVALFTIGCTESGIRSGADGYDVRQLETSPDVVTDRFEQEPPVSADILFVISNWWSDGQLREELVNSFQNLLNVFIGSGLDYHIGVISTDTDHFDENGKLREVVGLRWIDNETPEPYETFATMAQMHASGCVGPRRPRDATFMALEVEVDRWNRGFRRDDASLHTVFVSDANDSSYQLSVDEFQRWYDGYTDTPEIDTLSTIVDLSQDRVNPRVTEFLGGATHDIADKPWRNVLAEIGLLARSLKQEFVLSEVPLVDTIVIESTLDGVTQRLQADDYEFHQDRNSVVFNEYEPLPRSVIEISYEAR